MVTQGLNPEQVAAFNRDGYLLLPGELSPARLKALFDETAKLLSDFRLEDHPLTKFSTDEKAHIGDDYPPTRCVDRPKEKAINKIGHALHNLNDELRADTINDRNSAIAQSLGFKDPLVLQSMIICKQPEIGGKVPSHQDSVFLYTDDCTAENGALSFVAGSHKWANVAKRMIRLGGNKMGTGFITLEGVEPPREPTEDEFVMPPCPAGTLVLIHGSLLHKSETNKSQKSRYAYTFHMIEGAYDYDILNWLQVPPTEEGGRNFTHLYA
ncbi:hypothetical protein POJ06DRAFT_279489 [Lipomyces tetrasporus]|uniref:Phytanoyl-CoA dioxygenase n=1 Tax=Lipomyces tetrasporus TaxID=54092 RepID=A0AAD7QYI6_9ASCO|nr:uncharacterized protein POJ06DRAFT_279489 [Lipomyces tetrasporus]KAJ8103799.1 hypothetical protein POJ06DRAFT_279489 [Lipomyces tetrasporus]